MNETLQALEATPAQFEAVFNELEQQGALDAPREPGKWSPRFILAHLADVEALQRARVMAMLSEDNARMVGFNADLWAAGGEYGRSDPRSSLTAFSALRRNNLELWGRLTDAQLERRGTHPTRGEFSVREWLVFVAKHDANHLAQLEGSLKR
jgi:uncharacterized damage-inducible protein DinB